MPYTYAKRMEQLRPSEVRELLKVTDNKEIISFGGGLPAPELFPVEEIKQVALQVLEEHGARALQYTTTEGLLPLRRWVAQRIGPQAGCPFTPEDILLTNGSQQGLDLTGKVFLDEGDAVLCESPTYLSAIGAFRAYGCRFVEIATDDEGMLPESLEEALQKEKRVKLIYVVPSFQNPTGRTWSLERRKALAELAGRYGVMVVEDNPYGELRFEGQALPPVKAFDRDGRVILLGTFSKIFCPGYRIGWVAGPRTVVDKYTLAKQGTDLQCNTLAQWEIMAYLERYDIDGHIAKIKEVYRRRRDLAVSVMERAFPPQVRFTRPQGGLFLWVELPEQLNARTLLQACMARNVTFVPGGAFYPGGGHENTMRINFSNMPDERIALGLEVIGEEIWRMMEELELVL